MLKAAIDEIYHDFPFECSMSYSGKFKPFRANVRFNGRDIKFCLSKKWKNVSNEIQAGLIQELLLKVMKKRLSPLKVNTQSIELYNLFLKKIHMAIPKTETDEILLESFERINSKYFLGLMERTNLVWGPASMTKLGSYEYASDRIMISKVLYNAPLVFLDYVMYHEMLHKKHKFHRGGTRNFHHTAEFKEDERAFEGSEYVERQLSKFLSRKRYSRLFGF